MEIINEMQQKIQFEMTAEKGHINRWKNNIPSEEIKNYWEKSINSAEEWYKNIDSLKEFAEQRPAYQRQHIIDFFYLPSELIEINFITNNGRIIIDEIDFPEENFSGKYFKGLPLTLKAVPEDSFLFDHWEGIPQEALIEGSDQTQTITLLLNIEQVSISPVFKKDFPPDNVQNGDINCDDTLDLRDAVVGLKVLTNTKGIDFCTYSDLSIVFSDIIFILNNIANHK